MVSYGTVRCGIVWNDIYVMVYTANLIKVVRPKSETVNYQCARDDGLLFIFTSTLGIISLKQHRGRIPTTANLFAK